MTFEFAHAWIAMSTSEESLFINDTTHERRKIATSGGRSLFDDLAAISAQGWRIVHAAKVSDGVDEIWFQREVK